MNYFLVLCHQIPERCPWLWGWQLPLCWRCLGIWGAFCATLFYLMLRYGKTLTSYPSTRWVLIALLGLAPLFLDVFSVDYGLRIGNNAFRFISGTIFGASIGMLSYPALVNLLVGKKH